jgi:ribosomal protein S18 acetylase RimI-like enzyme
MEVADRVAAGALEAERLRVGVVEGGEAIEVDGLVVALTNLPAPELNATRVAREPDDPGAALAAAREVFRSRGHPFFGIEIEVGKHPGVEAAIREAGLVRVEAWPAMAAAIADLDDVRPSRGVDIRAVSTPEELEALRRVEASAFGTAPAVAERFIGPRLLADDRVAAFLATSGSEPVGQAVGYRAEDTVGVFGVGVIERARRRGTGAALTVRAARAFGDRADIAWLQPSEMARRLYEELGFRTVSEWEVWVAG